MNQYRSVTEVTGHRLDSWSFVSSRGSDFSPCHHVQNGSGA